MAPTNMATLEAKKARTTQTERAAEVRTKVRGRGGGGTENS